MMNPYNPDGPYELDLRLYDERKVALMLIWLADGEPGENWQDESLDVRFHAQPLRCCHGQRMSK